MLASSALPRHYEEDETPALEEVQQPDTFKR